MATNVKRQEFEQTIKPIEGTLDNELDFLKYLGQVKSKINKAITEDFTLAKLDDKDKEAVIEMTTNAYYILRVYELIEQKATKWTYNQELEQWEQRRFDQEQRRIIRLRGEAAFESYMTRILMTVVMNRNKPGNDLVMHLVGKISDMKENSEPQMIEINTKKNNKKSGDKEGES